MLRGFTILVSAFAALSARAQDAQTTSKDATDAAATALASRTIPESPPRSSRPGSPDGGTISKEGAPDKTATDCSLVEAFRLGGTPEIRTYQRPHPEPLGRKKVKGDWDQAPYVKSVARCGRLYVFQVWSESKKPWTVDRARVEGPEGEALQVQGSHPGLLLPAISVNVVVAEVPLEAKFSMLKLHLTGRDGRVAQPEVMDPP